MLFETFLDETAFMQKVTPTMPRPFYPGKSRPLLQGLGLEQEHLDGLRQLFFDADGSLSSKIGRDIDTSAKHGYINFQNNRCLRKRNDLRWQVPIKQHAWRKYNGQKDGAAVHPCMRSCFCFVDSFPPNGNIGS